MGKTPTTLIVMDGFGLRETAADNAVANARKPFLDKVFAECPTCELSPLAPEAGYRNMGAGRVVLPDRSEDGEGAVNGFGEYISSLGLTQFRIAESEGYELVTTLFNGGHEEPFPGEDRVMIPTTQVPTYDLKPDMSAREIAAEAVRRIESGEYDVIILNFVNCDLVSRTGVYEAVRLAVETVDDCVRQVVEATSEMGGVSLITAAHGGAEQVTEGEKGANPVPFSIVGANVKLRDGRLCDIAPTMLDLMGLQKPDEMTGETLIVS